MPRSTVLVSWKKKLPLMRKVAMERLPSQKVHVAQVHRHKHRLHHSSMADVVINNFLPLHHSF